jgi:hypothetical protein
MKRFAANVSFSAVLALAVGCGQPAASPVTPAAPGPTAGALDEDPDHAPGPHGGTVLDWGGGAYHLEFTVDQEKKEATVYVLGSDEKTPSPIKAETIHLTINDPMTELDLAAMPLEGEAEGTSSRFVGTHEALGSEKEFAGTISGVIEGTPYTGDFKEEPHAHAADQKH